jgi:hypothetical protein
VLLGCCNSCSFFGVVGLSQFLSGCRNIFLVLLGCCNSCDFCALSIFFLVVIMFGENSIVRFNGKNYASWEFQVRMFVKEKELWGHLDESSKAPIDPKEFSSWEGKDAKIASWLLNFVEPYMINNLRGFTTVKTMWDYLRQIYYQNNSDRKVSIGVRHWKLLLGEPLY